MVAVSLADGSVLTSTDGHPIWDATASAFTDAVDLNEGDLVLTGSGVLLAITAISSHSEDLTAYNLQIRTIHIGT